jgi:GT2 family glycosyltransferase
MENIKSNKISFILPSYNTYNYTKLCYDSLRKNLSPDHEIILLDDASTDNSDELLKEIHSKDSNTILWLNESKENIGISYIYNEAVHLASNEIICLLHSDMYIPPKFDEHVIHALENFDFVTTNRVEPPVYPSSNDKIQVDFGLTHDTFSENKFNDFCEKNYNQNTSKRTCFPWATTKTMYNKIGGNDELFLKYMVDDDDFYLRMKMAGASYVQIKGTYVYHFCSRSTKYAGDNFLKTGSDTWITQYQKSSRNFLRKWGFQQSKVYTESMDIRDDVCKYDIGLVLKGNRNIQGILYNVEPTVSNIFIENKQLRTDYIAVHQPTTIFDMESKFKITPDEIKNDIIIEFNCDLITDSDQSFVEVFSNLPEIIKQTDGVGNFQYGIFSVKINVKRRIENILIKNENNHTFQYL